MTIQDLFPDQESLKQQVESDSKEINVVDYDSLNKTELKAFKYLLDYYNVDEIKRESYDQLPDFTCPDKTYEAKRITIDNKGRKNIYIGGRQSAKLNDTDPVILGFTDDDETPRSKFKWSERDESDLLIKGLQTEICGIIATEQYEKIEALIENNTLDSESHAVNRAIELLIQEHTQGLSNPW